MHTFLTIQNTYTIFQIALFDAEKLIDVRQEDKRHTSALAIPLFDQLLHKNNKTIEDISFIAVNQGPGPFSTLRSIIATANGIHFATRIPLIGIDGLDATLKEFHDPNYRTIVLLNAFNVNVYYAIEQKQQNSIKGYKKIDAFLQELQQQFPSEQFRFIGNATQLYKDKIMNTFGNNALIPDPIPDMCSVETIGTLGLQRWQNKKVSPDYLFPLHLKKHAVEL